MENVTFIVNLSSRNGDFPWPMFVYQRKSRLWLIYLQLSIIIWLANWLYQLLNGHRAVYEFMRRTQPVTVRWPWCMFKVLFRNIWVVRDYSQRHDVWNCAELHVYIHIYIYIWDDYEQNDLWFVWKVICISLDRFGKNVSSSDPGQLTLCPTSILTFCLTCLSNIPCDISSGTSSCMSPLNHILEWS